MKVLVTGGAGYVGSHVALELLRAGHEVAVLDDFSNSRRAVVTALERLAGRRVAVLEQDITDRRGTLEAVELTAPWAIVHCAGVKSVVESVADPMLYYRQNVVGSLNLAEAALRVDVRRVVFSSSCTVYGDSPDLPIRETSDTKPISPYGRTKHSIELMLEDIASTQGAFEVASLRYFNPLGNEETGELGDEPTRFRSSIMPALTDVAIGKQAALEVYGSDFPTRDGTAVRDYIHVVDLARAHVVALGCALPSPFTSLNIGTGSGTSVLEITEAFERATMQSIPILFKPRRPGDAVKAYCDPTYARELLGWEAALSLEDMCRDAWQAANHSRHQ